MIHLTLRTKLIAAFLLVALLPMAILGFLNQRAIQQSLTDDANLRLSAIASQTASTLTDFINGNLNAVRSEAKLPVFSDYLLRPPSASPGGSLEAAIVATLHALSLKDFVNISSYALLDLQGMDLIDTDGADIGLDKSNRDYFKQPIETGLPYVSALEFASEAFGETGIYFSAPVRDAKGNIVGVLASRYRAAILQRLIADHNGLAGEGSFAILLDENHLRLAHGANPDQVFKTVVPLDNDRITELQANKRLPRRNVTDLATDIPSFEKGLDNATNNPYFQISIGSGQSLNFAAVTGMQKLPWSVVYTQPQNTFLAPMRTHTRNSVLLGFVIAVLAVIAALGVAQLLTSPIFRLTAVAKKIGSGDLSTRATVEARDEIGSLATTLNNMTQNLQDQITKHDRSEQEAIASRTLLVDAVEALADGFVIFDEKDRLFLCNQHYREIYAPYSGHWKPGTTLKSIARDTAMGCIGLESSEAIDAFIQARLSGHESSSAWTEQQLKNGRWIRVGESRLANNWTVGIRTDITQLKQVEVYLQQSEARFRDYAETAADYFWEMGPDNRFTHFAGRYQEVTGIPPAQVIGLTRAEMQAKGWVSFAEDSNPEPAVQARKAFTDAEVIMNHPDGSIRNLIISGKPRFDEDGNFLGYRGSGRDSTGRIRAQQERELLIKQLEVKNTELERFDYTISHELKSPLVTIAGFSGLLQDEVKTRDDEKLTTYVDHINSAVETMSVLLDELLELSRIGRIINPPETVALGDLAREIAESIDSQHLGREITIDIAADLPEVYGDKVRLREVLQNLINNSIKFCDGKSRIDVKIGSRNKAEEDVFYIQDNGEGIDPAYHEKVFGLFERLNPKTEGTGIGLALVRRILHEHGGKIWVESEGAGKGSTFCFTIPRSAT